MIKKSNKVLAITLPEFHSRKLSLMCKRSGLSKTNIILRLIEQFQLFEGEDKKEELPE